MRIELDAEADIMYIELRDAEVERTVDLDDGVHLDLDRESRLVGIEFLSLEAFRNFLSRHAGQVEIPDVVEDESILPLR